MGMNYLKIFTHTSRISLLLKHLYLEANLFISWLPVIFK